MKNTLLKGGLGAIIAFGLTVGGAAASIVDFDVAGAEDTYVKLDYETWIGTGDISVALANDIINYAATPANPLDPEYVGPDFSLDEGESSTFNFFTFNFTGTSIDYVSVDANLNFINPSMDVNDSGTGILGSVDTWLGSVSGGYFEWEQAVHQMTIAGTLIEVTLSDGFFIDCGKDLVVTATVTNHGTAPVPEPATMLLFGTGLIGLAGISRKRRK